MLRQSRGRRCNVSCGRSHLQVSQPVSQSVSRTFDDLNGGLGEHTPSIHQDRVASVGFDCLWIFDCLPGQLGERFSPCEFATFLLSEIILLTIRGVPDPVHEDIRDVKHNEPVPVPAIYGRIMICQIEGAVTVAERHASKVPED